MCVKDNIDSRKEEQMRKAFAEMQELEAREEQELLES